MMPSIPERCVFTQKGPAVWCIVASEAIGRLRVPPDLNKPGLGEIPRERIWFLSPDRTLYVSVGRLYTRRPLSLSLAPFARILIQVEVFQIH